MSNEKKPFTWDKKKVLALLLLVLILGLVVGYRGSRVEAIESIPSATEDNPKFVLAEWEYPDEHNQGIYAFKFYENSTGSWLDAPWYTHYYPDYHEEEGEFYYLHSYDDYRLNWSEGVAMKIRVDSNFNNTVIGAIDEADGQNYLRHNVTVTRPISFPTESPIVFSQQNFTYLNVFSDGDYWQYQYEVILNFLPLAMTLYTITIDYELAYESPEYVDYYLHECENTTDMTYDSNTGLAPTDYGIGSDGSIVEIWIVPDSSGDEFVIYKLDFPNFFKTVGYINLTVRYKVEDSLTGFRLDLYYDDATSDTTGLLIQETWADVTIDADIGKTLDYALLRCDDTPDSTSSGNHSVYIAFINITTPSGGLAFLSYQWTPINSPAILMFSVSFDEWGYNVALVILGLVMIPASTLYLAYGIKHDRSSDRLFYGLIIFFLGFGLLIAGIMP